MERDAPLISILIPVFNRPELIAECLESVIAQTYSNWECIVVDDGSSDGTQSLIQKNYPEVDLIKSNVNLGFGSANNIGIKKAYEHGASYVFLLNQDAWIEVDTISSLLLVAKRHPEFYVLSPLHLNGKGNALDYNFSNYIVPKKCKNLYSDLIIKEKPKEIYELPGVNAASWLLRRECIKSIGGFNPSFSHYGEDDNFCKRVIYHGYKVGIVPSAKIFHDREFRKDNDYFIDKKKVIKRKYIFKLSDPYSTISKNNILFGLYKSLFRDIFLFKYNSIKDKIQLIQVVISLDKTTILNNKLTTQKIGLNFLE